MQSGELQLGQDLASEIRRLDLKGFGIELEFPTVPASLALSERCGCLGSVWISLHRCILTTTTPLRRTLSKIHKFRSIILPRGDAWFELLKFVPLT